MGNSCQPHVDCIQYVYLQLVTSGDKPSSCFDGCLLHILGLRHNVWYISVVANQVKGPVWIRILGVRCLFLFKNLPSFLWSEVSLCMAFHFSLVGKFFTSEIYTSVLFLVFLHSREACVILIFNSSRYADDVVFHIVLLTNHIEQRTVLYPV